MPPELENVRDWLERAALDLRVARRIRGDVAFAEPIGFHCQQAAEKALKGLLDYRGVRPPKTHALAELLDLTEELDATAAELRRIEWLTQFAVAARYPGFELKTTQTEVDKAIDDAQAALDFVLDRLPDEVRP